MYKRLLALMLVIVLCLAFAACGSSEPTAPADTTDTTVPEVTREAVSTQTVELMENDTITLTRYDDDYVTAEVNFADFGPKDSTCLLLSTVSWISNFYPDFEVTGTFSKEEFRYVYNDGTIDASASTSHSKWYSFSDTDEFIDYAAAFHTDDIKLIENAVKAL